MPLTPPPPNESAKAEPSPVVFESRSIKVLRGREGATRAQYENQGWEFVSQMTGVIRSDLLFRRPKRKPPWLLFAGLGAFLLVCFGVLGVMSLIDRGSTPVAPATAVETTAAASGTEETSAPSPRPTPTPTPTESASTTTVREITVDALLDMLNSADMGGSLPGDRYHVVAQTFMRNLWFTGATGDFAVMLSAKDGAQDLTILTDATTAAEWRDGTIVDFVLEDVERTIGGETSSGWLLVVSATVVG